jgi:phytoene dehydrogenase-like protein
LAALWVLGGCGGGVRGEIGRACMAGGRNAANPQLCSCIQGVANQSLSGGDQGRVAAFFADPERAEAVRASDSSRDEAFWERYRAFTSQAEAICG